PPETCREASHCKGALHAFGDRPKRGILAADVATACPRVDVERESVSLRPIRSQRQTANVRDTFCARENRRHSSALLGRFRLSCAKADPGSVSTGCHGGSCPQPRPQRARPWVWTSPPRPKTRCAPC